MRKLRSRLTYANVMSTLAVVLVVAGGTAYAANTIGSADIINGQVKSADLGNNQVQSIDVRDDTLANGGLTGADIKDQTGVDTCVVATLRLGQLCVRAENSERNWFDAMQYCANLGLRLPSLSEALELAQTHDIPNVEDDESFWTADIWVVTGDSTTELAYFMRDDGSFGWRLTGNTFETVCVTTPTN